MIARIQVLYMTFFAAGRVRAGSAGEAAGGGRAGAGDGFGKRVRYRTVKKRYQTKGLRVRAVLDDDTFAAAGISCLNFFFAFSSCHMLAEGENGTSAESFSTVPPF